VVGQGGTLAGGGVRLGSDLAPLHGWAIDALVESGTLRPHAGTLVNLQSVTLGGMLYFVKALGSSLMLRGGAGLRAGVVRSVDKGAGPTLSFPVFWGWPMGALASTLTLNRISFELAGEGGYATLPAGAGGSAGVWFSLQLGVGADL
jgi:hypothetical protein